MLFRKRTLRLVLLFTPVLALTAAALVLAFGPGTSDSARADAPHAGLVFSIGIDFNGDGTNDCGTGVPSAVGDGAPDTVAADVSNATCNAAAGATLNTSVYLMAAGGIAYAGETAEVYITGVTSTGRGTSPWTGCVFAVTAPPDPAFEVAGCAIGVPPATSQTNLGAMNKFVFTCTASGTIRLGYAGGETSLTDDALTEHREAGPDQLTVTCGGGSPVATNTPVIVATSTPVGTTNTPGTPPATPTRTNTPVATTPSSATPTRTTGPTDNRGDVNGDHAVTSTDALWILWKEARIVDHVPLPENADVNHDGRINAIDALFILWRVGGQITTFA